MPVMAAGVGLSLGGQADLNEASALAGGPLNGQYADFRVELIESGQFTQRAGLITTVVGAAVFMTGAGIALVGLVRRRRDDEVA